LQEKKTRKPIDADLLSAWDRSIERERDCFLTTCEVCERVTLHKLTYYKKQRMFNACCCFCGHIMYTRNNITHAQFKRVCEEIKLRVQYVHAHGHKYLLIT